MLWQLTTCGAICCRFATGSVFWRCYGNPRGWPSAVRCHGVYKKVLTAFKAHNTDELSSKLAEQI